MISERNTDRLPRWTLLLTLPALLFAPGVGQAAPRDGKPAAVFPREIVETLSAEQRTARLSFSEFRGLSKAEAELVIGASQAAVYVEKGGVAYALTTSSAPRTVRTWAARDRSGTTADPWAKARLLRTTTVEDFAATVNSLLPDLQSGEYGAYVTRFPYTVELPERVAAAQPRGPSRQSVRPAALAGAATVLNEDFETDPFASRWGTIDLDGNPNIAWGWTACDAHTGTHSMDGGRGGSAGSVIGCTSNYPQNQFNLMGMTSTLDLTGASTQSWMQFFMNMNMFNNPNLDFIGVLFRDPRRQSQLHGFRYSGNQLGAWWRFIFDLKEWTPKLDLTLYTDNLLFLVWGSDATPYSGFGARLDDITITTDIAPAMTCDAAVNTPFGQAPLSVTLTGSSSGGTGTVTYLWDPNDGTAQVAGQVLPHTYTTPGEYSPIVFVTDAAAVVTRCTASVHVSAARNAAGSAPTNDVCTAAKTIAVSPFTESISTATFTQDANEPQPCGPGIGNTAWYKFVAPSYGTASISLCSSNYDTVLAVYTGSCGSFTNRYCSDDVAACGTGNGANVASKLLNVQMTKATTYWIQVGGSGGFGAGTGTAQIDFTFTAGTNGDANGVGGVTSADILYLINFIFAGGAAPLGPADVNGDGNVNAADILYLINFIFSNGPPPVS